jgi:hypothetical protein
LLGDHGLRKFNSKLWNHELKIFSNTKPVRQAMRRYSGPRTIAMEEEINRLLDAKFIRELKEAKWLSPPVMVAKNGIEVLRMCIDFTTLNKHCPKDYFPLP